MEMALVALTFIISRNSQMKTSKDDTLMLDCLPWPTVAETPIALSFISHLRNAHIWMVCTSYLVKLSKEWK